MFRVLAAGFAMLAFAQTGLAQTRAAEPQWPARTIRFIVPFPAGSSTDVVSRIVTRKLGERLGQSIIIENRVGASGDVGADAIARARPDGYTMGLATTSTHAIAASLNPQLPYDPVKDFAPVAMVGVSPYALAVREDLPARNVAELIALAKDKPGLLTYSTVGPASLAHLAGELFALRTGVKLTSVPYGSASQAVFDVYKGLVDMQFGAIGANLPMIRDGKLRALAVTSARRAQAMPEIPTLAESGLADYDAALWMMVVAPAETPSAIVARAHREMIAVLAEADTQGLLAQQGVEPDGGTPEALRTRIAHEIGVWRALAVEAKARGD